MIGELQELVCRAVELTDAKPPAVLGNGAVALASEAIEGRDDSGGGADDGLYWIGLIGGKDVGKSALVNALVGREITARTSHGPGTEHVIAYAHADRAEAVRRVLQAEVPNRHKIVEHDNRNLRDQVLLDLPDIDSHHAEHIATTRKMLRHMLFPVWLQSVEKYADMTPRRLLAEVAEGNAPENFVFCLNKADQLIETEGEAAGKELADDFAARLAGSLALEKPPRVWMLSAIHPDRYDLPELAELLGRQKKAELVAQSRSLAEQRQGATLLRWLDGQRLDERLAALERLEDDAREALAARIGAPVAERVIPAIEHDRASVAALADDLMERRVVRWPIVNLVNIAMAPLSAIARQRFSLAEQQRLASSRGLVASHLAAEGIDLSAQVQGAFAHLCQTHPAAPRLYSERKLWEPMTADPAAESLRAAMAEAVEARRAAVRSRMKVGGGLFATVARVTLTFGAAVWFPFFQPFMEIALAEQGALELSVMIVQLLGASYLLKSVGFLAIYFAVLWLVLKWDSRRRVERWLGKWDAKSAANPETDIGGRLLVWMDGLVEPIGRARGELEALCHRIELVRKQGNPDDGNGSHS